MSSDIPPLVPVSSPPLVREKRHYPGEQKNQQQNKKKSDAASENEQQTEESDADKLPEPVNTDNKNVKVGHIDEYV